MDVLAVVPARGGSRRVPRKNLQLLGGTTLVRRALETALAAGCFERVALSSDDAEVLAEARGLDVAAIERPAELAGDRALTYDAVVHALAAVGGRFEAVAVVQCTSPFTAPGDLAGAVELLERTGAGSVVSVARVEAATHPLKLKRMGEDGRLEPYLEDDGMAPSHDLPPLWVRNGSVYLTRVDEIEAGRLIAADVRGYEMPAQRSHDVDTTLDLEFARFLLESGRVSLP